MSTARDWHDLDDGRKVTGLTGSQWSSLRDALRRYYAWVESGRMVDPWASGVASASRTDRIQVKHHRPSGGYDAGRCADDAGPDPALVQLDAQVHRLPAQDQALLTWRIAQRETVAQCALRLDVSSDTVKDRWTRVGLLLHHRLV